MLEDRASAPRRTDALSLIAILTMSIRWIACGVGGGSVGGRRRSKEIDLPVLLCAHLKENKFGCLLFAQHDWCQFFVYH